VWQVSKDNIKYLEKGFFYFSNIIDEPRTEQMYNDVKHVCEIVTLILDDADKEI
jgi:hypothetical protein